MADFHQHGIVTALHQMNTRTLDDLEGELLEFRKTDPMALILPSLYSELEGPALPKIVDELCQVPYLDQIVIGLDRADESQYRYALDFFNRLPQRPEILWNDGPRLRAIDEMLKSHGLAPEEPGKGRNVWYMFGYILATKRARSVALHDCDIVTYKRDMLARLIYPVANPRFSYRFCKGYYARIANQSMHGRVCRLLVTPLVRALGTVCGQDRYLEYLDSFRYALAGEFALHRDVIEDIRIPVDWGLEMGILSEMYRNYATGQICQVDIADVYDHKHQDLSAEDKEKGLSRMSGDIAKSLYRKMATQGIEFSPERIRTLKATYYRVALDLVESYENDALMNGLRYDRHSEIQAIELFAQNIIDAGIEFLENSKSTPFLPSWKRVVSAMPDIFNKLVDAVSADMQEFGSPLVVNPTLHPEAQRLRHRIELHVEEIYGADRVEAISNRLLDEAKLKGYATSSTGSINKWSQRDVVAISYGDTITSKTDTPLRTLHQFLLSELRDVITSVHILPFFPYSSDDGFSIIDYYEVNPDLGTWTDIERIGNDFKLMSDIVLNHCSRHSGWFKNFLEDREPGRDYFIEPDSDFDFNEVVRPRSTPLLTTVQTVGGERQVWCTFGEDQVDLDFSNPEVLFEVIRILRYYVRRGIKLFRLDAVAFLWKESGTSCVHLRQTHEIIKLIRLVLENLDPETIIITETNVPNRENLSYFGNENEAHLIYNFSLPPLLIEALLTGDCTHLKTWMMSMPPARQGRTYFNFLASHDGVGVRPTEGLLTPEQIEAFLDRLRSFGGTVSTRQLPSGEDTPYEVNISLYDALKGTIANGSDEYQRERFISAHTILLAIEGLPGIYIHSLLGTENDNALVKETGRARSINRHRWDIDELNAALDAPQGHHRPILEELKRRIGIRCQQEAFHPNATQYTLHFGSQVFAFWRESQSRKQSIFALHNVSDQPQEIPLVELNLIATETWRDLLTNTTFEDLQATITIPPYAAVWITNQ